MYVRLKKNNSGSVSVQILNKVKGKNQLIETVGCAKTKEKIEQLERIAYQKIEQLTPQLSLNFTTARDSIIESYLLQGEQAIVRNVGPKLILGKIFDQIGLNKVTEELFRDVVLARLIFPTSKLKTCDYLERYEGKNISVDKVYRFMDRFHKNSMEQAEKIIFEHSSKIIDGISMVFYDITTLYYEADDEDDLRKIGFSKDGKFQHPQILVGLLVTNEGYPLGYSIFEGNCFEGKTLIPVLNEIIEKHDIAKPVVVADSGLLTRDNLDFLESEGYKFIFAARLKSASKALQEKVLQLAGEIVDGKAIEVKDTGNKYRLIVSYSLTRAKRDSHNRNKALRSLEKVIKSGKLQKQHLTNRGYKTFLKMENEVNISIDDSKIAAAALWDGIKGYYTNTKLKPSDVVNQYKQLWHIERAFRISKTDLRVRPVYHYRRRRIETHMCVAFAAYAVYKELERQIKLCGINISVEKALEEIRSIYQINFTMPDNKKNISTFANLSQIQQNLLQLSPG